MVPAMMEKQTTVDEGKVKGGVRMKPVLIVDDEAIMRESLRDWLTDKGYQVETAEEGEEALKTIAEQDFGIVILDLRLPGKDGIEVLREAKEKRPQLKGVIITAYPSVETSKEAAREGAVDYLPKPFALNDLEKSIREALGPVQVEIKPAAGKEKPKGREAILAVLARAADDSKFLARLADNPTEALNEYYTLTHEEMAALASGDIKKIEGWLGKLDERHATWLWCRLSQEKW